MRRTSMVVLLTVAAVALAALVASALRAAEAPTPPSAATQKALAEIGTWDGKTPAAELAGPYENPLQATVPFGQKSYYLAPWRAYMDTWPAQQFLDCLGINFNVHDIKACEPVAALLAEAGIRSARVEVGLGSFKFDDPTQLNNPTNLRLRLEALKKNGIRPLMLLNANSGAPCPMKAFAVKLLKDADEGATEIFIDKTDDVRLGYTGLRGQEYQTAFPLIVAADKADGRCRLSAPLKKPVKAGRLELYTLKYAPVSFEHFADGKPNPAARETLDGWMTYVAALCRYTKEFLGTEGAADAGFDIEVWNELTFGSQWLEDKCYYKPAREFTKPRFKYKGKDFGYEILLPMTVDYVRDPANKLPGVALIDGFSNQRPWEGGGDLWPGQTGFSRHYYTGLNPFRDFDANTGLCSPENDKSKRHAVRDALGKPEGKMDKGEAVPGTYFVPTFQVSLPETWFYGYKTEMISREFVPWPDTMKGHGRFSNPGDGRTAQVWQTEFNVDRQPWAAHLMKQAGCAKDDPALLALLNHVGAKALLRTFFFYSHKGQHTIEVFAANESDLSLGVIPGTFYAALAKDGFQLTDAVRAARGEQLAALGRAVKVMKTGQPLDVARPLAVARLVEEKPRLVFRGDGTPAHPDRFQRDDFACLPFQMDAGRFAVAYYVVTRNMGHEWAKGTGPLDPARYDMPDQTFQLTLGNVRGTGAKVSAYDPLTDRAVAAAVLASTPTTLTVSLPTADSPRLLVIEEAQPGPMIIGPRNMAPRLTVQADGSATLTFSTNMKVPAKVSWGTLPDRESDGSKTLGAATTFECAIPKLAPNTGVKIVIESDGLTTRWPHWGQDAAGVYFPGKP